jgi:hypothetical protein
LAALLLSGCADGSSRKVPPPLTIDDILRLQNEGVGSKAIIAMIETSGVAVHPLTLDDVVTLRKAGLNDEVLAELIKAAEGRPREERRHVVVHELWPDPYYYRGPVYAPYWW